MADKKTSAEDVAGALAGANLVRIVQGGGNFKATLTVIAAFINGLLGTASTKNVGTAALNVVQLDGAAKLPAVDGSQLTGLSASGHGAQVAVAGAATLNQGSGVITSEALVAQVAYTLTLTNSKVLVTSTVIAIATNSANLPVTVNTITEANGSVVILVGMAALTGTVKIRFAVFN